MRLSNRLLATLVAAALVAAGLIVAVEIVVGYYLDRQPWLVPHDRWYRDGLDTTWSRRAVMFTFVLIGLAGLVLLALQWARRPPSSLALRSERDDVHADISRRSLEHALTRATQRVDGVADATVRLRRRRAAVRVTTDRRFLGDLRARVVRQADTVLDDVGLVDRPTVDANVRSRRPAERTR